jgi:hypothetical protein
MAEHSGLIIYSENEEDARASLAVWFDHRIRTLRDFSIPSDQSANSGWVLKRARRRLTGPASMATSCGAVRRPPSYHRMSRTAAGNVQFFCTAQAAKEW